MFADDPEMGGNAKKKLTGFGTPAAPLEAADLGAVIPSLSVGIFAPDGVVEGVMVGSD